MNTKHIFIGAMAVAALGMTSCSDDFFDTSSKTTQNTETAYSNLETAEVALVGCYDGWQRTISDVEVGMYLLAEFASEQAFAGLGFADAKNNNVLDQFNLSVAPSYNDLFNADWTVYYAGIFRCNQLLANDATIDWKGNDVARGRVLGETRVIRAMLYFDLVRMFGDVPLLTTPSEDNLPRTAASEVYKLIFEDLKYAAANIPANAYPLENRNANDGRHHKICSRGTACTRVPVLYRILWRRESCLYKSGSDSCHQRCCGQWRLRTGSELCRPVDAGLHQGRLKRL